MINVCGLILFRCYTKAREWPARSRATQIFYIFNFYLSYFNVYFKGSHFRNIRVKCRYLRCGGERSPRRIFKNCQLCYFSVNFHTETEIKFDIRIQAHRESFHTAVNIGILKKYSELINICNQI